MVPLWPSLRSVLPPQVPQPKTQATHWSYDAIRPLLQRAGERTPIEKAERRVLVLANPGHGLEKMQASAAIYLGMQLLLPGEWAPAHRHTPNAVRMIVEGEGAFTTIGGEKVPMCRGDLILTPSGLWHVHGHDGDRPVVWLDVLDLPLMHYLEASYHVDGTRQDVTASGDGNVHSHGGLVPAPAFERRPAAYLMFRYPWADTRAALQVLAAREPELQALQLAYVNPQTGGDAQNVLGFYALMLRPGQTLVLPARSLASVCVNEQVRQNSDVGLLIWNVREIIEDRSLFYHLQPGDLIFTGTADGVGPVVAGDRIEGGVQGVANISLQVAAAAWRWRSPIQYKFGHHAPKRPPRRHEGKTECT